MSFERDHRCRKDWRKPYLGKSKCSDRCCRPHGSCGYCRSNRLHSPTKGDLASRERLQEFGMADPPMRQQMPKSRKQPKKRWGIEFYAPWFGHWKVCRWYSTAGERDKALARLERSRTVDPNGRPLRHRKSKR